MDDLFEEPSTTREEILQATHRALAEHGYADLTIKRIGDELEKSPSLVYHHYADKDDLVLSCLEAMLDRFEAQVSDDVVDPRKDLEQFLDLSFASDSSPDSRRFVTTLVELRSQACHDDGYRRHFTRSDRVFESYLATLLRAGIDQGTFRECDPDRVATTIFTTLVGAMVRRSTTEDATWLEDVRPELQTYLETRVYR